MAKELSDRDYLGILRGEIVWNSHTNQWEKRRFVESLPWWKHGAAHPDDLPDSPNGLRCRSRMQQHAARAQDQTPHDVHHEGIGTTKLVRLLDRMNTWKAFVSVLALFLIIDGFLFYRYQQQENIVPEPPPTAPTSRSFATSNEDGEGGQAETQSKENDAQPDGTDNDQHDSSSDLQGTEAVAYPLDPIYEEDPIYEDGYYPPDPLYAEEVAYE